MRIPIRINRERLPAVVRRIIPNQADPRRLAGPMDGAVEFEECVGAIKVDSAWKTTARDRHPLTDAVILETLGTVSSPAILEVAISSGSTTLDLLGKLGGRFSRYYATDRFLDLPYRATPDAGWFYHPQSGEPILRATDWTITYRDTAGAVFPLGPLARRSLARAPDQRGPGTIRVSTIHPELRALAGRDPRITLEAYSIFDPWPHAPVNMVKVANVLNAKYFTAPEMRSILATLGQAILPGGNLVITDNRESEGVSLFTKTADGDLRLTREFNQGTFAARILTGAGE